MSVLCSALMCAAMAQSAPPGFDLVADYDLVRSELRVSAARRTSAPADAPPPKLDRWRIADGRFQVKVARLGGSGSVPRVLGLDKPLADPVPSSWVTIANDPNKVYYVDGTSTLLPFDWTGCKPGYYRITITAAFEIENRRWPNQEVTHGVYWQPTPVPSTLLRVGQKYLSTTIRSQPWPELNSAPVPVPKIGSILTIKDVLPKDRYSSWVTLTGGGQELESEFREHARGPLWLHPVMEDASTRALTDKYLGKTVYPMVDRLKVVTEWSGEVRYKHGTVSVVIRGVWRAARYRVTHFMLPDVFGSLHDPVHAWLPLYVVFDVSPSSGRFYGNENLGTRLITCVADPWEFERVFSLTSMNEDCKDLIGEDGAIPRSLGPGMTPKQVAWIWGWPLFVGTQSETFALREWRYAPNDNPQHSFFFKDGKLLPGKYVR